MKEFDENQAVDLINSRLGNKYPADELLNIIDMIWDYYETNGMLEIDDEPDEPDTDLAALLTDYVLIMLAKDPEANVDKADVPAIVKAELDYEQWLEDDAD